MVKRSFLLFVLAALQACSVDDSGKSNQVANASMHAEFSAQSSGPSGSVDITAVLLSGSTYLYLTGNDALVAANGLTIDEALNLDSDGLFGGAAEVSDLVAILRERYRVLWDLQFIQVTTEPSYFATYTEPDFSKPFYVSLLRTADQSIKDVAIALPPPFELVGAPEGQRLNRSDPISIAWSPAGYNDDMQLNAAATCVSLSGTVNYRFSKSIPIDPAFGDPGVTSLSASEVFGTSDPAEYPLGACAVSVAIKRIRIGIPTTAFGGGCVTQGIERRVVNFTF